MTTSKKIASKASDILRNSRNKKIKSVAASDLSNRRKSACKKTTIK